jgi:hypothetical protein
LKPFDTYPEGGRSLLGPVSDLSDYRYSNAADMQSKTGQTCCAYCGADLTDSFDHWLLSSVERVVPVRQAAQMGVPPEYRRDAINTVLVCLVCSGLSGNYYVPESWQKKRKITDIEDFLTLRDKVFEDRKRRLNERRDREREYYQFRPWEQVRRRAA